MVDERVTGGLGPLLSIVGRIEVRLLDMVIQSNRGPIIVNFAHFSGYCDSLLDATPKPVARCRITEAKATPSSPSRKVNEVRD